MDGLPAPLQPYIDMWWFAVNGEKISHFDGHKGFAFSDNVLGFVLPTPEIIKAADDAVLATTILEKQLGSAGEEMARKRCIARLRLLEAALITSQPNDVAKALGLSW